METEWIFKTEAGSIYLVRVIDARWFVAVRNFRKNGEIQPETVVEIYAPIPTESFPPAVGTRLFFQAKTACDIVIPYGVVISEPITEWGVNYSFPEAAL